MYFTYILRSIKDGRLYKGITADIQKRIQQHNDGNNRSTKPYTPWELVHFEKFETRIEARAREKFFKSGIGREFLKELIKNK